MNQNKMKKHIFFVILMISSIGIVTFTSLTSCQVIHLNSNFEKTISLNSEIARGGSTIFANGSLVYLIEDNYGFEIYNVSIKDEPEVVDSFNYSHDLTWEYSNMIVQNYYVYFLSQDINRITILDCSNISDITTKAVYTLPAGYYTKFAVLDWNIFTITSTEFSIYNFTDFSPISLLDQYTNTSASFSDLTIDGNYTYILDTNYGLTIFNITNSTNILKANDLVLAGSDFYTDFYVTEEYVYIYENGRGLHIYDISNPLAPVNVAKYEFFGYAIKDLLIKGDYAFILHSDYFDILNVSNLLDIQLVGTYTTEYIAMFDSISVDGNFAYLTSTQSGELQGRRPLYIVDITDLESPVHVYPGDPYKILSDLARLLLIIAGVVSGILVLFLAIFIPIFLTIKKKQKQTKGQM